MLSLPKDDLESNTSLRKGLSSGDQVVGMEDSISLREGSWILVVAS